LQGFAEGCESRIPKPFSILRLALRCRALRSRWCQSGVNWSPSTFSRSTLSLKKPSEANDISEPLAAAAAPDPRERSVRASEGQERKELGLSVEVVHRTPKPTPEKVARVWAEEWFKEGWQIDWQRLLPRRGFEVLPRRWV
jgi:hypothetical protein